MCYMRENICAKYQAKNKQKKKENVSKPHPQTIPSIGNVFKCFDLSWVLYNV